MDQILPSTCPSSFSTYINLPFHIKPNPSSPSTFSLLITNLHFINIMVLLHLLHGKLDVTIYEVDSLQTLRGFSFDIGNKGTYTNTGKKILSQLKNCIMCQCQFQPEVSYIFTYYLITFSTMYTCTEAVLSTIING